MKLSTAKVSKRHIPCLKALLLTTLKLAQRIAADPRLSLRRALRLCRSDPYREYLQRRFHFRPGNVSVGIIEKDRIHAE